MSQIIEINGNMPLNELMPLYYMKRLGVGIIENNN